MSSSSIRVYNKTYNTIKEISRHTHRSKQEIVEDAIEEYRRKLFLIEANKAFNDLRDNHKKWQDELEEREEWEVTITDGLEKES